jgi:hypothetical protein
VLRRHFRRTRCAARRAWPSQDRAVWHGPHNLCGEPISSSRGACGDPLIEIMTEQAPYAFQQWAPGQGLGGNSVPGLQPEVWSKLYRHPSCAQVHSC